MTPQSNNRAFDLPRDWEILSKVLKAKFSELTDSDIELKKGNENDLIKRIGSKLKKNRFEVIQILRNLSDVKQRVKKPKIFMFPIPW